MVRERSTAMLIGFNFLYYAMMSIFMTYLPVYFAAREIAPAQIGILLGVGTVTGIVAPPLWGYLSDRWRNVRMVLLFIVTSATLVGTIIFQSSSIWAMFLLVVCSYFFISPIGPLTDSINYRVAEERGISFGSIRLFGSVGFGLAALVVGVVLEQSGMGSLSYLFLASGLLAIAMAWFLPNAPASSRPVTFAAINRFFSYRPTLWMLVIITLLSIPHRANDSFLGVYIQQLGGSTVLVGQAWFLATISEAIVFALGIYWLKKGRELPLMAIAAFFYVIRYFLSGIMTSPHWIAWLQLFHGITYAFFYAAAIQYLYRTAPEELRATSQTVFGAIFFGLSGIIGSVLGGWVMDTYGGKALYQSMAWLAILSFMLVTGTMRLRKRTSDVNEASG